MRVEFGGEFLKPFIYFFRRLPVPTLQDEGLIFLWVTGRAMELGRECLKLWGYERVDEIIWVKTNQVNSTIKTPLLHALKLTSVNKYYRKFVHPVSSGYFLIF